MIQQCAWCGLIYGEKEPCEDKAITHTICPTCYNELTNQIEPEKRPCIVEKIMVK